MEKGYSLAEIHQCASSYQKVKSSHVITALYSDFVPWQDLPSFSHIIRSPTGRVIEFENDPAVIIGEATFRDKRVCIIAQQTPSSNEERGALNYGLVKADGYGLAYNMMCYAEMHRYMLHTWIDTVGGDPFEYSAGKLQSWLISYCQDKMIHLRTRSISTILGRGGSGGAIALQLAHRRLMLQLAEFSVITVEGCASIIYREVTQESVAAALEMLRPSADSMLKYGIIDEIIAEPHIDDPDYLQTTLINIEEAITQTSDSLQSSRVISLRKQLIFQINACGELGKQPFYKRLLRRTKRLIPHLRPKSRKSITLETALMRAAIFNSQDFEPLPCNHEYDPKDDSTSKEVVRSGCLKIASEDEFKRNHNSCPSCHRPQMLTPEEYIHLILDNDSFEEFFADLTCENIDPRFDFYEYTGTREKAMLSTVSKEALVVGEGLLFGLPVCVAISDFGFMGGSLGSIVGEKMRLICNYAIKKRLPLISVSATGGARMQEGTIALYQMAKTIATVSRLKRKNLPFISILGHPTTGGTLASYAVLGDFIIAETQATICFAGHRVVKLTSGGRSIKPETALADFFVRQGGIHIAVERSKIKSLLYGVLTLTPWYQSADLGALPNHTHSK